MDIPFISITANTDSRAVVLSANPENVDENIVNYIRGRLSIYVNELMTTSTLNVMENEVSSILTNLVYSGLIRKGLVNDRWEFEPGSLL